jgi:rhodanese-related sulfurtransferase
MQALETRPDLVRRTARITAPTLAEHLAELEPPMVLDVRTPREWADKHIVGSCNIPLNHLRERLAEVPRDRPVVVHCASGYRSAIAVSLFARHGFTTLADLVGGFAAWEASPLEAITASAEACRYRQAAQKADPAKFEAESATNETHKLVALDAP